MTVYFNSAFMQKADVSISPDDRGFVFGDGVYEVVRAEDGAFFRLDAASPAAWRRSGSTIELTPRPSGTPKHSRWGRPSRPQQRREPRLLEIVVPW